MLPACKPAALAALLLAAAGCTPQDARPGAAAPLIVCYTYLTFFDWDSATLTEPARQVVAEAAARNRQVQRLEIQAHADRSGPAAYNQRLSLRRAEAVAAELEKLGIDRAALRIMSFGETRPLMPTPDGVKEPQNRRVEIVPR